MGSRRHQTARTGVPPAGATDAVAAAGRTERIVRRLERRWQTASRQRYRPQSAVRAARTSAVFAQISVSAFASAAPVLRNHHENYDRFAAFSGAFKLIRPCFG